MSDILADESGLIVKCGACGQRNRLPYRTLDHATRCGKCQAALARPGEPIEVPSAAVFDALVETSPVPVLVDYWAAWCGPCLAVAPEVAKVAASEAGRLLVVKVDTEAVPELAGRANIRSIPTMAVFSGGREAGRTMGARPAAGILTFVTQTLSTTGSSV